MLTFWTVIGVLTLLFSQTNHADAIVPAGSDPSVLGSQYVGSVVT